MASLACILAIKGSFLLFCIVSFIELYCLVPCHLSFLIVSFIELNKSKSISLSNVYRPFIDFRRSLLGTTVKMSGMSSYLKLHSNWLRKCLKTSSTCIDIYKLKGQLEGVLKNRIIYLKCIVSSLFNRVTVQNMKFQ